MKNVNSEKKVTKLCFKKTVLKSIFLFTGCLLLLTLVLTAVYLPHKHISDNGYMRNNFYNTVLEHTSETFLDYFPVAFAVIGVLFLINFSIALFRRKMKKNLFSSRLFDNKFYKIISAVVILITAGGGAFAAFNTSAPGPNVILIAVDTLRSDYTLLYNKKKDNTTELKEFITRDASTFPNAYANSPWTLPSFASMMTALYPSRLNVHHKHSKLPLRFITLAEYLKENGYITSGFVSNMFLRKKFGFAQGFDHYCDKNVSPKDNKLFGISSPGVTSAGIDFIKKNKDNKFFLFLHYFDPHYYYHDHDRTMAYSGLFSKTKSKKEEGELVLKINMGEKSLKKEDIDYLRYCYRSEIKFTQEHIDDVLAELKKHGLYDNSIIIVAADHGEEYMERGSLGHGHALYEELIKVPLAIKLPGNKPFPNKNIISRPVSNLDLMPTLLALLNIESVRKMQGRNLLETGNSNKPIFSEVNQVLYSKPRNKICAIQGNWKLILDLESKKYELYDLEQDPKERDNKIEDDENGPGKFFIKKLKKELMRFIAMRKKYSSEKSGGTVKINKEEEDRLKSLGYI